MIIATETPNVGSVLDHTVFNTVDVFVLGCKTSLLTQPVGIIVIGLNIGKYFFNQFFFLRH